MMARLLQAATLAQWLLALLLVALAVRHGTALALALPLAAAALIALHGVPLAIEFITGALLDRRPGPRLPPTQALALWWAETWISWRMFGWCMPYRAGFVEPPLQHDPARPALLLIHGFACNRAVWRPLLESGQLAHCNVATINLEPPFGAIEPYAEQIHRAVEALRQASGAARVILVCHSMGGLAARAYLRTYGVDAVARVITIATPHQGTLFARFGHGKNARQMRPGSAFLQTLLTDSAQHIDRFVCIASRDDNLIVPRRHLELPGARHLFVEAIGHLQMVEAAEVQRLLLQEVTAAWAAETPTRG